MEKENTIGKKVKKDCRMNDSKSLEVITRKEASIKDLEACFQKSLKKLSNWNECREYFSSCMDFLKTFELSPKIIAEFNTKMDLDRLKIDIKGNKEALGLCLSAMIQSSYEQGHNNFEFDDVYAACFGAFLKGQPGDPIKIITKRLEGYGSLSRVENVLLNTKTLKGGDSFWESKKSLLTVETLEGNFSLKSAEDCLAEITNYQGEYFGFGMKNCAIKSGNEKTLEMIKKQQTKYKEINKYAKGRFIIFK